jgi:hypothetical protein
MLNTYQIGPTFFSGHLGLRRGFLDLCYLLDERG